MRFGNCNCNGHRANKEYYTYNFSHDQETGTNIVFGVDADEDIELTALLEYDDLMPVRKSFKQVRSFKAIVVSNICNVQSMSARQAQEPTDNLSAQSMDQECFEGDTLCCTYTFAESISVLSRKDMPLDSFDYIIPNICKCINVIAMSRPL